MNNKLQEIVSYKRQLVKDNQLKTSIIELEDLINENYSNSKSQFAQRITNNQAQGKCSLIAEIKKSSPSKGVITHNFDLPTIVSEYVQAHTTCMSILTDEKYFNGRKEYIKEVKKLTNTPVLRKDFIIDPYQIYESKSLGADCILLICSILSPTELFEFEALAYSLNMDVLIETHNKQEIELALNCKSSLLGINNRNLKDFTIDINTSIELKQYALSFDSSLAKDKIFITESGIQSNADISKMLEHDISAFLIGSAIMESDNKELFIQNLFNSQL